MRDRFDLEQDIMNCWNIVDDINLLVRQQAVNEETIKAISVLYQQKFEGLWATFEECVPALKINSKTTYGIEGYDTMEDIGFPNTDVDYEKRREQEIENSKNA